MYIVMAAGYGGMRYGDIWSLRLSGQGLWVPWYGRAVAGTGSAYHASRPPGFFGR